MYGIKTCMWLALHGDNIKNGNIIRQYFIQPEKQVEFPVIINVSMEKKLAGMHMGIGTAAAKNGNGLFKQFTQRCLYHLLYTGHLWMFLPAIIPGAMIGYVEEISQWVIYKGRTIALH